MTHEEMDCEESVMIDESHCADKEDEIKNSRLVKLHRVNFFEFTPKPINCVAYDHLKKKIAIARFDGEAAYIEIWNTVDNWYHEQTLASYPSVEAMVWHDSRLFCAGLSGELLEYDLRTGKVKESISCNFGPIWCLAVNRKENLIAAGTDNGSIVFFEILDSQVKYKKVISRQGKILSICWQEEENLIVTGGFDVMVWDAGTGEMVQKISTGVNKETKIWAVAVTRDFTIIAGDSSGHTTFFFGKPGHLAHRKRFETHGADIHSIGVNQREDKVCVGGVDGMVTFEVCTEPLYEVEGGGGRSHPGGAHKTWVNGKKATHHVGDVKDVRFLDDDTVVTAGLDCQMIVYNLKKKKLRKISYIQQKGLVHTARKAGKLLLQYPRCLELWSIGDSSKSGERRGEVLEVDVCEEKLLRINSSSTVVCCCVGPTARVVFFSNESGTSGYWIKMTNQGTEEKKVEAIPVSCPPEMSGSVSSHMEISPNGNLLAAVSRSKRRLTFYDLQANMRNGVVSKYKMPADSCVQDVKFNQKSNQLAVACSNRGVSVVDVKTGEMICSFPKRDSPPHSIDFHPVQPKILVSHMDATITELFVPTKTYTKRSLLWTSSWHQHFSNYLSRNKIGTKFKVVYATAAPGAPAKEGKNPQAVAATEADKLLCQHDHGFTVVDWTEDLSRPPHKRKRNEEEVPGRCKMVRFKHTRTLFHLDVLDDDNLLVVERNASELLAGFAPTFRKHKYGT